VQACREQEKGKESGNFLIKVILFFLKGVCLIIPDKHKQQSSIPPDNFKQIFDQYYLSLCRHLALILGNYGLAEDLAQETFMKLLQSPPSILTNVGGWLTRVGTNLAYNYLRSEKSRQNREAKVEAWRSSKIVFFDEAVSRNQEIKDVQQTLAKLTPRDRICLVLKFSGYNYAEIAEVIEVKKSSVGTILARAQAKFREAYLAEKGSE